MDGSIILFGKPDIYVQGTTRVVKRKKAKALLFYLAAQDKPCSREQLIDVFWPGMDLGVAAHNLSVHLHFLKDVVPGFIVTDQGYVMLANTVTVDVRQYEKILTGVNPTERMLEEAVALYTDEFLKGFLLADSIDFSEWQRTQTEYYKGLQTDACMKLAECLYDRNRLEDSRNYWNKVIELDPYNEYAYLRLMQLYDNMGNRMAAIMLYHHLKNLLQEEMGVSPTGQLEEYYTSLICQDSQKEGKLSISEYLRSYCPQILYLQIQSETEAIPFVGRKEELCKLEKLVSFQWLTLLNGQAGSGKTSLMVRFLKNRSELIFYIPCSAGTQDAPYQAFTVALRHLFDGQDGRKLEEYLKNHLGPIWVRSISLLIPEWGQEGQAGYLIEQRHIWEAIYQIFKCLTEQRHIFMLIDDIHWADIPFLGLIQYLLEKKNPSLICAATKREFENRPELEQSFCELTRKGMLKTLKLGGLSETDILLLSSECYEGDHRKFARWLQSISGGNAYIITEMLKHLKANRIQKEKIDDLMRGDWQRLNLLPESLMGFVDTKLNALSEMDKNIVRAATVVDGEVDLHLLQGILELTMPVLLDAMDHLTASGILFPLPNGTYAFYHMITRDYIYQSMDGNRRRFYHERAAQTLEKADWDAKESKWPLVAWHYERSENYMEYARCAMMAGDQMARLATYTEAIKFYEDAIRYLHGEDLLGAYGTLVDLYFYHIETGKAIEMCRRCVSQIPIWDCTGRREYYYAMMLLLKEDIGIEEITHGVGPYYVDVLTGSLQECLNFLKRAEEQIDSIQYKEIAIKTYFYEAIIYYKTGNLEVACRYLDRVLQMAEGEDAEAYYRIKFSSQLLMGCICLLKASDNEQYWIERAETYINAGYRRAIEGSAVQFIPHMKSMLGAIYMMKGKDKQAYTLFQEAMEIAEKSLNYFAQGIILRQISHLNRKEGKNEQAVLGLKRAWDIVAPLRALNFKLRLLDDLISVSSQKEKEAYCKIKQELLDSL